MELLGWPFKDDDRTRTCDVVVEKKDGAVFGVCLYHSQTLTALPRIISTICYQLACGFCEPLARLGVRRRSHRGAWTSGSLLTFSAVSL